MRHAAAPCLLACALACPRASDNASSDPQPETPLAAVDELEIVAVPQLTPRAPDTWRFDSDTPRMAARLGRDCGIWDIPTGTFVGTMHSQTDGPCEVWADGKIASSTDARVSADGSLEARIQGAQVQVSGLADGSTLAEIRCEGCTSILDLAWAADEHQLVILSDAPRIETWNLDVPQRLRTEEMQHEGRIVDGMVGWNDEGITAVLEGEIELECEYNYNYDRDRLNQCEMGVDGLAIPPVVPNISTWFWPADGSAVVAQPGRHVGAGLTSAYVSPQRRDLFLVQAGTAAHGTESYRLISLGLTGPDSGLRWGIPGGSHAKAYDRKKITARWRGDSTAAWIASFEREIYARGVWRLIVGYEIVVFEPEPIGQMRVLFDGEPSGKKVRLDRLDAAGGTMLLTWEVCGYGEQQSCETHETPIAGCEAVALDPTSPTFSLALAKCGGQLALVEPGRAGADPGRIRQRFDSIASTAKHRWGSSWLALLEDTGRLFVVDPNSGHSSLIRESVSGFADVALAGAHDRLAIFVDDQLELLAPTTGASVIRVPAPEGKAGCSPDGTQLAAVEGEDVLVWSISTGAELTRWSLTSFADEVPCTDVVFRQDGAALLIGSGSPRFSVDPSRGQHSRLDTSSREFDYSALDPSWRWARMHDGSFLRTLDERRLWVGVSETGLDWAWLDDGQFEGEVDAVPVGARPLLYRIGDRPLATPRYTAEELRGWLERPGLTREFFSGSPLSAPRIPAAEVPRVEHGPEARYGGG